MQVGWKLKKPTQPPPRQTQPKQNHKKLMKEVKKLASLMNKELKKNVVLS